MQPTTTYYGIDVSKDHLHISWQTPQGWQYEKIANTLTAIQHWIEQQPQSSMQVIAEHTGSYSQRLVVSLSLAGVGFSLITPTQSKGFQLIAQSTAKTDHQDSMRLALYGHQLQPPLTKLPDQAVHELRQAQRHLADLQIRQQAIDNQLHALSYDPRANSRVIASLQTMRAHYQTQIELFQEELDSLGQDELKRISQQMQTVVGIGPVSGNLLAVATQGLAGFDSARALAKFVGVAPSVHQSGRSVRGRGSIRGGHSRLRRVLYMAARSARRYNQGCRGLYERLRARGKCHKQAMIAVINKLLHQVFAVVTKGVPFDNNYGFAKENMA